ncbi:zinc finger protein Pegasus-like isoform X2 [Hippocampus zosterae]|nr:zinc finger protein Pegasus-like isoform X2 [Hippocampus zosterae]
MDGLERTCDGKYKCSFCSYANRGMARLIEHIRTHTGEKPHRCQLCPFASAYERHLEAHMRSHTGEKPYKCDLCAFRCSDRSNLSHHRRRRHKQPPARVARPPRACKRGLAALQKRGGPLGFGRRARGANPFNGPLEQLADLRGVAPSGNEKPIVIQEVTGAPVTPCSNGVRTSTAKSQYPGSSAPGLGSDARDEPLCAGGSRPGTPLAADTPDCDEPQRCPHCDIHFPDNVLYTIHMGCHVYEHPFRCNVCGRTCADKYDFACHFAQGQHRK